MDYCARFTTCAHTCVRDRSQSQWNRGTANLSTVITASKNVTSRNRSRLQAILATGMMALLALVLGGGVASAGSTWNGTSTANTQAGSRVHEASYTPGPGFNVRLVSYASAHDFDSSSGVDTCMSVSVPPGDTFTLELTWQALIEGPYGAGDLDLYLYSDSACTPYALLTSSFNSNAYTGELIEITPQVRNVGSQTAIAGVRIGKRNGKGTPGMLKLQVRTGATTFAEHGTDGPPLQGPSSSPAFSFVGPFSVPENSAVGTVVGAVTATDPQGDAMTFFELDATEGQGSFQINADTGEIVVEDPSALDREYAEALSYWIGVTDGVTASLVEIGIDLTGVNDNAPVAVDANLSVYPDVNTTLDLSGTDADIDPAQQLVFDIVEPPLVGMLSSFVTVDLASASIVYTPTPGFLGTDTFTFTVSDGATTSAPATVTLLVTSDAPVPAPTPVPEATSTPIPAAVSGGGSGSSGGGGGFAPVQSAPEEPQAPVAAPPSAPRAVSAAPGDSSVAFTWDVPLSDGGAPVLGYRIFNVNTASPSIIDGNVTEAELFGLINGTAYLFQVQAFNSAGIGDSALVGPVTPVLGTPIELEVQSVLHLDDSVSVWWSPPDKENMPDVSAYEVWLEGVELLDVLVPDAQLFTNITGLTPDAWHSFRVTALDEEGEVIATGITEPIYLPTTLAGVYDPLPGGAILFTLSPDAATSLQMDLELLAGIGAEVTDAPSILTLHEGVATVFIRAKGLHRQLDLSAGVFIDSEQVQVTPDAGVHMAFSLALGSSLRLSGVATIEVDPTGIRFTLRSPVLEYVTVLDLESGLSAQLELVSPVSALSADFSVLSQVEGAAPANVSDALADSADATELLLVSVSRVGVDVTPGTSEKIGFSIDSYLYEAQLLTGSSIEVLRVDSDGQAVQEAAECAPSVESDLTLCTATLTGMASSLAYYALLSVAELEEPQPVSQSAPSDAPGPTPVPGPSLVVVEEPTPTPVVSTGPITQPQTAPTMTPTPPAPVLPESGGNAATVVTWLMSGLLGIVVLRGAVFAVGRIKA